ncbi:late competence development ComFB family protein [Sinanaerobacter sp. ZZT-01]|uniref:late competence development ComFB family protein n=1 Tax=Sinanaerobacter sp. ZZT-01 TaxID=3111540 RepID=UPI002D7A14B4|nr:late competence development ComFB family protein [Sinanaerobacter sp. ZZT-01]WRR93564.1 late competence development ComFB family protein [Sinanaerobacter sp. ZZT-01]
MSKKSSKTSHVLNLLTNRVGVMEPAETQAQTPMQASASEPSQTVSYDPSQEAFLQTDPQIPLEDLTDKETHSPLRPKEVTLESADFLSQIKSEAVQEESLDEKNPSDTSTTFSLPLEDPLSDLIYQKLENYYEAEMLPFISNTRLQKEGISMSQYLDTENHGIPNQDVLTSFRTDEYVFINIIEEFVKSEYASLMNKMEVCHCNKCKNDVIALALNNLPPKYVVTRKGYLLSKLLAYEKQYKADVLTAVTNACMQVKSIPHHV